VVDVKVNQKITYVKMILNATLVYIVKFLLK
jgi:hypothetical protein